MTASINPWPPTDVWEARATARTPFVDQYIPKNGVGCELGVYCGQFTQILLDVANPIRLYLIDPWTLLGRDWESFGVWGPTTAEAKNMVLERYKGRIDVGQVVVEEGDDLTVLPTFENDCFDFAYIDTIHSYDQCMAELQILKMKVKPSGVICGDDWVTDPHHPSYGVSQAVLDFAAVENYDLLYGSDDDAQFAITRK